MLRRRAGAACCCAGWVWGCAPCSPHCLSLSSCSYFFPKFPTSCFQSFPVSNHAGIESQFHPPFGAVFAYICIAHRFLGGEEELERHILYAFIFFPPLSAELHLFSFNPGLLLRGAPGRVLGMGLQGKAGTGSLVLGISEVWTKGTIQAHPVPVLALRNSLGPISESCHATPQHCRNQETPSASPALQGQRSVMGWGNCLLRSVFFQFPSQNENANPGQAELPGFGNELSLSGMLWMQNASEMQAGCTLAGTAACCGRSRRSCCSAAFP